MGEFYGVAHQVKQDLPQPAQIPDQARAHGISEERALEEVILAHPAVTEAAVVGAPDAARGTVVRAVVVTNGSVPPDQLREDLRSAVRDRLGRHAYPRIIDFVDELPKTDSGKVRRNLLRSPA